MCVTCLQVDVNKDSVVQLQLRHTYWLWESRKDVMGMTSRSYADCILFCTVEQSGS